MFPSIPVGSTVGSIPSSALSPLLSVAPAPADLKPYVYVLVRTDISDAQQLVQVGHAAWEAGQTFAHSGPTASLIVLAVKNLADLEAAAERLARYGIDHVMFHEPDFGMGHSAIATRPLSARKERFLMKKYPLYGTREVA